MKRFLADPHPKEGSSFLNALLSRRGLWEVAEVELRRMRKDAVPLTAALIGVDLEAACRGADGASRADVMRRVTEVLCLSARRGDWICRYDKREFFLLMPGLAEQQARRELQRMTEEVQRCREGLVLRVGAVTFLAPTRDVRDLVRWVAAAMFSIKEAHANASVYAVWPARTLEGAGFSG
jgi:GGDEF domain-containing protein